MAGKNDIGHQPASQSLAGSGQEFQPARGEPAAGAESVSPKSNGHPGNKENGESMEQAARAEEDQVSYEEPRQRDGRAPGGMIDRSLQAQLGRQLRSIYSGVASEPVPGRFVRLLEELASREKSR